MSPPSSPKSKASTSTATTVSPDGSNKNKEEIMMIIKRKEELLRELENIQEELLRLSPTQLIAARDVISKRKEDLKIIRKEMISLSAMQTLRTATINEMMPSLSSPQKLMSMNKGLIHLLQIIDKAPNGQIPTRKLLDIINSRDLHKLIKKGEELGFIRREKVPKPKGQKGNDMVVNSLTETGHDLLKAADKLLTM